MRLREDGSLDLAPVEQFQRRWVGLTTAIGGALLASAVVTDVWLDWENILPSVLLELGAAFFLAAILVFVERRLVRSFASALVPAYCTLAEPAELIARRGLMDMSHVFACGHRDPNHRWDIDTGRRLPDHRPNPGG